MKNGPRKHAADHSEGPELVACQCPNCKMLSWHKGESTERRICPFCCGAHPDYVTRIAPEVVAKREKAPEDMSLFYTKRSTVPAGDCDMGSPFVLEFFMVQGSGFRCMAYRNHDGKWRGAFDDEVLPGAIRVLG